ncbi:MAG: response regulator transcription factor [Bacteroidetes bacterium]|jgi:two-component system, NarL family, response regulator NreC|nr:response regulator transcription factor [Chloroflexota bacterium]MBT4003734.1 response regulator transcription factor [Chloroflexota bacterium]MBT6151325.1 response regulator transcription factor [Chloroflexota bacterium]MBT6834602.1 response regulator transcription factor [Bacteroidota bacterium]MBT6988449.1 response regulator transcription factor [Chloroflexota bacterium]
MSKELIRVMLVDDHQILRDGLKILIDGEADLDVIGEANNGEEALSLVNNLKPDVIIIDLGMPGMGGLEAIRLIKKTSSKSKVVVLTMHGEKEMISQSFKAGSDGFVPKSIAHSSLLEAIRAVMKGERYLNPDSAVNLMEDVSQRFEKTLMLKDLSEREVEVFTLVALGYSRTVISKQLSISPKTVDTYRVRAMEKLGLENRAAMIRFAIQAGMMVDEE